MQFDQLKRHEFITLVGSAAGCPLGVRPQQPAMPVVGYLDPRSADTTADLVRASRQDLKETGYVGGESVAIEPRWAEHQLDRLPELATNLVRRQVAVILSGGETDHLT
jgi:putative ABC transport system substrate-binding protein